MQWGEVGEGCIEKNGGGADAWLCANKCRDKERHANLSINKSIFFAIEISL